MTDEVEQRARAIWLHIFEEMKLAKRAGLNNAEMAQLVDQRAEVLISQALRAERKAVWKVVIAQVAANETVSPFIGPLWNAGWTERSQSLLRWLREQAAKEGACRNQIIAQSDGK